MNTTQIEEFCKDGDLGRLQQYGAENILRDCERYRWLRPNCLKHAASNNHLHVLKWFYANVWVSAANAMNLKNILKIASCTGNLSIIQWSFDLLCQVPEFTDNSMRLGYLAMLNESTKYSIYATLSHGALEACQWLVSQSPRAFVETLDLKDMFSAGLS